MDAFLIDPEFGTISKIDISRMSTLKDLYRNIDCDRVDLVRDVIPGHDLWVDDEGLLYETPPHGLFKIGGDEYDGILAGRAVVLSYDDEGHSQPATCSAEDLAKIVEQVTLIDGAKQRIDTAKFRII